ncbi:putative PurR-regulated permease PerM [Catalinimonas alkaloidigena]|uniref:AI-2E family transporter n=1 Tax=Catalinimonas alkaloidigena TaxID=1075417 RepID=UPI0024050017|nr:AI-2E family transporter [Catalinimonas alkaloidigena]MDF9797308.1 putative PurR-regulated permease PerM [Catalinimonas alkaloidigena]
MQTFTSQSRIVNWAAFFLLVTLITHILVVARPVLIPLVFAGFIAILFSPLCTWLEKYHFPRWLTAIISLLLSIIIFGGIITFFYSQTQRFASDLQSLGQSLNELVAEFAERFNTFTGNSNLVEMNTVQEALGMLLENNTEILTQGLSQMTASFIQIMLFMSLVVLFLIYRDEILKFALKAIQGDDDHLESIILKVKQVVRNYIIGIFLVILILAACNSIALWAMDIEHALFFAVFAAILNIVPFIGPLVGSILPALFALVMKDSLWYPFGVVIYFIIIQSFESYMITPNIVGRKVSVNPMFTILAIFVGNLVWGIAGMILFIPFTAMLKQIFDEVDLLKPYGYIMGGMQKRNPKK